MTHPQKQAHSAHLQLIPLPIPPPSPPTERAAVTLPSIRTKIFFKAPLPSVPPTPRIPLPINFNQPCKVRGCVFRASERANGVCWIHALWEREPEKFRTLQPTHRVLEMAKYGITTEDEDSRVRQLLRARADRRAFLEGVA